MEKLDLKSLVKQYPGCMDSRAKLRATLLDCYVQPEHRRDINIVLAIYESGLLPKIQEKDSLSPRETATMCDKIKSEYGISPELAVKAIISWGEVWGTSVSAAVSPAPQSAPSVTKPVVEPAVPKPITPIQGSVNEYVIAERENSWFITKFQGFEQENMIIPNIIDGKTIVGIERGVFQGCRGIKTMVVSEGIRFLGDEAFKGLSMQIQLPSTLEKIGSSCFAQSYFTSFTIPNGVTHIGKKAFESCEYLTSVSIGNGVVSIGAEAFRECKQLTTITVPDSVIDIGPGAFYRCGKLLKVVLPKYLKEIRAYTFSHCGKLSDVSTPEELRTIGKAAFSMCRELRKIRIPSSVTSIAFGERREELNNKGDVRIIINDSFGYSGLSMIYCAPGSAAMEYARKKGIKCFPL